MKRSSSGIDWVGVAACFALALAFLGGAVYRSHQLISLNADGKRVSGRVTHVERNVKLGSYPTLSFRSLEGEQVLTEDMMPLTIKRVKMDDDVVVLYNAKDPRIATIDFGWLTWAQPILFVLGFAILITIALIFVLSPPEPDQKFPAKP